MKKNLPLALTVAILASLTSQTAAYGNSNPHYGAGRRIPFDSIRALTFYDGHKTAARRTSPVPQLTCEGKLCRKFQPDVVSCTSLGDGQWKCEADLPSSIRLGRVEVSCEGYESPRDPYVLKDSCGLTYKLLPAYGAMGADDETMHYRRRKGITFDDVLGFSFPLIFIGVLGWILWGFVRSIRGEGAAQHGRGGGPYGGGGGGGWGGWGGGPGGWGPGWGSGGGGGAPPPPYSKMDPSGSSTSGTAQGGGGSNFWTGAAAGAAAGVLGSMLAGNRRGDRRRGYEYDPYAGAAGFGGGGLGAGWTGGGGTGGYGGDSMAGPSGTRSSTGYGGTRNR
ncbi:DUF1183-domain-containing protein [Jaminaea rosea]|uniref:Store-operated calcium entry-associated regulatory factor n=1 Tax=Jaminaea rosea TaxID=1569628 RepID=A0A316UYP8_9BASI|nr:DUF1183-domain-containing protein [Jaminaea rosea]PWN30419.1 DUF1183-domain-containing protein [Jaminaea rosea]